MSPPPDGRSRWRAAALLVLILIGIALFARLSSRGAAEFARLVSTDDSVVYLEVGRTLATTGHLIPSVRTPGYPVFLAAAFALAGPGRGIPLAIAVQAALAVLFAALVWRLIERLTPGVAPAAVGLATFVFGWAALGMALLVLSDFLAALCFTLFVYGFLFARTRAGFAAAGAALFVATLTRPTFTLVPLLLPILAWLAGRATRAPGGRALAWCAACSVAATLVSSGVQYSVDRYPGPSPVLTANLQRAVARALEEEPGATLATREGFEAEIARRAGRPIGDLTRGEQEEFARALFRETFVARPAATAMPIVTAALKYVFAPVEAIPRLLATQRGDEERYDASVRPIVTLVCLPLWLLALWPPGGDPRRRAFHAFMALLLLFTVGLSAIAPMQGERMRFPILALMMPVVVWNAARLRAFLAPARR